MNQYPYFEAKMEVLLSGNTSIISKYFQQLPVWILWKIWKSRNLLMFQQRSLSWESNLALAKNDMKEWLIIEEYISKYHGKDDRNTSGSNNRTLVWKKPLKDWIKFNYDGSFTQRGLVTKASWIMRDENGVYIELGQATGRRTLKANFKP